MQKTVNQAIVQVAVEAAKVSVLVKNEKGKGQNMSVQHSSASEKTRQGTGPSIRQPSSIGLQKARIPNSRTVKWTEQINF